MVYTHTHIDRPGYYCRSQPFTLWRGVNYIGLRDVRAKSDDVPVKLRTSNPLKEETSFCLLRYLLAKGMGTRMCSHWRRQLSLCDRALLHFLFF